MRALDGKARGRQRLDIQAVLALVSAVAIRLQRRHNVQRFV